MMRDSFKFKHVTILTIVFSFLICAFFITSVVLEQVVIIDLPYTIDYTLAAIGVVLLFFCFLLGDIKGAKYRRQKKLWTGPLPLDVKQKIWNVRTPLLMSGLLAIILMLVYTVVWRA